MYKKSSAKVWRKYSSRYMLSGSKCSSCNNLYYDKKQQCPKCGSMDLNSYEFKSTPKLLSWSEVFVAGSNYDEYTPYVVAIIEVEKGVTITSQLVDITVEDLKYGDEVRPIFRKVYQDGKEGLLNYGVKFTK